MYKKYLTRAEKKIRLHTLSAKLILSTPRSECWFQKLYKPYQCYSDKFNIPIHNTYIPDVSNLQFKYIIEIDGSVHDKSSQQLKDRKKDSFYKRLGYKVFRIEAYNHTQFTNTIKEIEDLRKTYGYLKPRVL